MATNITWSQSVVTKEQRTQVFNQKGITLWFTGLSGSGKSTIAIALENELINHHHLFTYRLDGDNVRFGLNKDLGFSQQDRVENIRRIGEVAKLFNDSGLITITSFISPYIEDRKLVRDLHENSNLAFVEVFIDASLEEAEKRDPKGLYVKARQDFTGISAPYEQPQNPDLYVDTNSLSVEQSVQKILLFLESQYGYNLKKTNGV